MGARRIARGFSPRWFGIAALVAMSVSTSKLPAQWAHGTYLNASGTCPPFVFVSLVRTGAGNGLGIDVDDEESLGVKGRKLMFMAKERTAPPIGPALLFPRQVHINQNLFTGNLNDGSVHEPCIYHDVQSGQFWVIFAYAWNLQNRNIASPCELYAINLTAAVQSPDTFNPDTLPAFRLTTSPTTLAGVTNLAFNPTLFPQQFWSYGISSKFAINSGPCVVDEEHGPVLYFATNERRADGMGLNVGDLIFTANSVQMINKREIQHFGTTSLISFFETPGGAGGSYRSSTESTGQWGIFEFRSDEGFWQTMTGYANEINISDHNGTTVAIDDNPKNSRIAVTRYYINNNEGFGTIVSIPYEKAGSNNDTLGSSVVQSGLVNHFPHIPEFSDCTSQVGKFGLPAGGRKGTSLANSELFLTYSPLCSHDGAHQCAPCTNPGFHATLVVITDLQNQRQPRSDYLSPASSYSNPAYGDAQGVNLVLRHPNEHAFSMKPILTHAQRFGYTHRTVSQLFPKAKFIPSTAPELIGMPVAKLTAGPIYNTDVRPQRRRGPAFSYDPSTEVRNGNGEQLITKLACLTKDILPENMSFNDIWGVRVFVTDPKVRNHYYAGSVRRLHSGSPWGYLHHNGATLNNQDADAIEFERYRHLSDVPAETDGSISFLLPSNLPIKLHLLHKDGSTLAAHRNHHSFATGQSDNRCGGCHQHRDGLGANTSNLIAFQPNFVPFNTMTNTGKLGWNAAGQTVFTVLNNTPSVAVPEFKEDIWPILQSECKSCHDSGFNPNGTGLAGFNMSWPLNTLVNSSLQPTDQQTAVWAWLHNRRFINRRLLAAKSPLSWYFTGVANDTVNRLDGEPNSRYPAPSKYRLTTSFGGTNPHPGVADKSKAYKVIEWIDSGAAINHSHATTSGVTINGGGVKHDGFQIAIAASLELQDSEGGNLTVGYWDVAANVTQVTVNVPGFVNVVHTATIGVNGKFLVVLPAGIPNTTKVSIEARDANDNRSRFEKSMKQLLQEADAGRGEVQMTNNGPVFSGGSTMTFTIKSGTALANAPFMFLMAEGIYPGTKVVNPGLGLFDLPNSDSWFNLTFGNGIVGALDAQGNGSFSFGVPSGFPPVQNLYCEAIVFKANGTVAESNLNNVKIN